MVAGVREKQATSCAHPGRGRKKITIFIISNRDRVLLPNMS